MALVPQMLRPTDAGWPPVSSTYLRTRDSAIAIPVCQASRLGTARGSTV
jgi:hypothetical protein